MDSHLSCLHMHAYVMEFTLLQGNFRLQELDLSHNEFCEEGGVLIGPSLGECNCHTELGHALLHPKDTVHSTHTSLSMHSATVERCQCIPVSLLPLRR